MLGGPGAPEGSGHCWIVWARRTGSAALGRSSPVSKKSRPLRHAHNPHSGSLSRLRGIVFLVKETEVWDLKTDLGGVQTHTGAHSRRAAPSGRAKLGVKHSPLVQIVAYPHCYTYKYYQKLPLKELDESAQSHPAASGAEGTHILSVALCCCRPLPFLLSHPSFSWLCLFPARPHPTAVEGAAVCRKVPEGRSKGSRHLTGYGAFFGG